LGVTVGTEKEDPPKAPGFKDLMGFTLSLPERITRGAVGTAAGSLVGGVRLLLPDAFKKTKSYEVVVNKLLRFLVTDVGLVEGVFEGDMPGTQGDQYMKRKVLGNLVEGISLLTLHVSPVWVLAVLSDVAGQSRGFLQEVEQQLKEDGVIEKSRTLANLEDLARALAEFSGSMTNFMDTPPLSAAEFKNSMNHIKQVAQDVQVGNVIPTAEVKGLWDDLVSAARKEGIPVLTFATAMTTSLAGRVGALAQTATTGVSVGTRLFNENILGYYAETLKAMHMQGYWAYVGQSTKPYLAALSHHMDPKQKTWTEKLFGGGEV